MIRLCMTIRKTIRKTGLRGHIPLTTSPCEHPIKGRYPSHPRSCRYGYKSTAPHASAQCVLQCKCACNACVPAMHVCCSTIIAQSICTALLCCHSPVTMYALASRACDTEKLAPGCNARGCGRRLVEHGWPSMCNCDLCVANGTEGESERGARAGQGWRCSAEGRRQRRSAGGEKGRAPVRRGGTLAAAPPEVSACGGRQANSCSSLGPPGREMPHVCFAASVGLTGY